ncbi:unnamed protein product, partial [Rotaria sp. Silwood1]
MFAYLSLLSAILFSAHLTYSLAATQTKLSNICSATVVETKNDTCPNGSTFNIMSEYEKPASDWRIDFNELRIQGLNTPDQVVDHIRTRSETGSPCLYQRKVEKQVCCKGWTGKSCDEPICTVACVNGQCTAPDTCSCHSGYAGEGCQFSHNDPRLVQCYRKADCSVPSRISNESMSISYCCGDQAGVATVSADGSCKLCSTHDEDIANITAQVHRTLNYATCVLWGRDHIRTFDGFKYDFQGACQYKLTGTNNWEIDVQSDNCDQWTTCKKTLSITLGGFRVMARGKTVSINGVILDSNKGYVNGPLTIERRTEDYTYLRYSDGVRCKWDNEMTIYVTVEQTYMKQVKGLCGTYTNKVEDDLELPDGSLSTSVTNFANEWRTDSGCAASAVPINPCSTPELLSDAEIACRPIRDPFDSFKLCNRVINDTHIFEACKRDHCASAKYGADAQQQAICSAFEAMARDCADNYIHVNWRKSDRCAKTCYNDKIYTECATTCPATCQNHRQDFRDSLDCSKDCAPGCVCPVDTVIDLGRNASCVKSDQCTCYYHGKYYLPRQTIAIDCNECMCNGGTWSCTKKFCSRTCSVIGTNHIQTFDGKNYAIRGSCEYILVQEINSANGLYITMTNDYKSTSNYKELTVKVNQTYVFIKDKSVYINGEVRPTLPFKNDQITVKRETTVFFVLSGRGFQIQFDGIRAYIRLDPLFVNNTRGLCGTYDFNSQNDFLTHISIVETNIKTFVDDYKVDAACATPSQQHPCQQNVANEKQAQNKCAILKSELFAPCSSVVNPSRFIDNCEFDICSDANARFQNIYFCSAVAAYARECYLANVTINWLTDSRIQSACQDAQYGQCTGGAAYRDCAPKCSQTCHQLTTKSQTCYERECIAGCSCPSQTYLDISIQDKPQCVPQSQCSCYDSESNTYVKTGGIVAKSCGNCTCKDGEWDCESQICEKAVACPANQIYSTNASSCPKTCDNMKSWQDCGSAFEGCTCPDGQVLSHDLKTCVVANSCPCRYAGHLYGSNEIIKRGCSECHCSGASWSCIERKCDATCSASGDPHYSTFDGLRYSYQGNCKYILTQTKDKLFRVITENIQCGTSGVTCAKNILIKYNSLTISLIRGREPIVNDVEITDLTLGRRIFGDVALMKSGLFVFVNSSDFTIRWDEKTRIYVTIHGHLKGQMAGLCGDFDGDSSDDLNTANGVPGSISEMAESWKVEQTCVTGPSPVMDSSAPCANYEARKEWAEKECYKIIDKSETNPFLPCIKKLDETVVRSFYIECLYDACHCDTGGDCECLCTSLSAFAEKCQSIDVPVKWRTQDKCPIQCEYGKIYMSCGPICQPTCRDIYLNDNYNCVESGCQEGCFCPEGQVMDETGACVIPPECPCVDQNLAYPAGSKIIRNCDQCECMNGTFHCEKLHGCVPKCSKREFTCNTTGNCIPLEWVCDKTQDCDDGSDEFNCNCTSDDFFCTSGQCIKPSYRCDGLPQCRDGSDELNCNYTVPCTEFLCENKRCIPTSWLCDGVIDCSSDGHDRSDERHCNVTKCDTDSGREFLCNNMPSGKCLPIAQLCDGHDDCGDGSDEINCNCTCSRNGFACKEFCQCIPVNQVCDGTIQCQDGSDEQKCKCNQGEYTCNGGLCINATKLCDGQINCPKGDDEAQPNCNITTTIPPQTSQRSTEKTSTPISPVTTTPFCKTRLCFVLDVERCIPENEICDGEVFCDDGMDEIPSLFPSILKCQATTVAAVTPRTTTPGKECLPPNKYICNLCLEPERFCNGICDCKHDCSDEKNCTTCTLKCKGSDVCILPEQICDKKCDCFETCSDEQDCIMPTPPPCTQFKCDATKRNPIGKCLNLTRVCDGYADCVDKTDEPERLCNYTTTQVTSKPSLTTTTTVPEVCTNASLTYKAFSLNSPLVLSASSPQLPDISQDREISSANPITITGVKVVQITVNFPSPYQVMEVHLKTTKKLQYFFGNTREQHRQINAVIISSPTDKSFEYLLTIISPSTQPTRQLSLAIVTSGITDITSLTITACIGTETTPFITPSTQPIQTTPYRCNDEMGLRNGFIPTSDISVSSQKEPDQTLDSVRMGNPKLWVAARDDLKPWIEIRFSQNGAKTLTGFQTRGEITAINIQYDTISSKNIDYAENPIRRTATSAAAISTILFVQPLIDVTRIQLMFDRVLSNTAIMAQIELLGCVEASTVFSTTTGTIPTGSQISTTTIAATPTIPYICDGTNVLADDVSNQADVQVFLNNEVVTPNVKENGLGVDLDDNEYIIIQFSKMQTIDSVDILSDSNVKSYSVSYTKSNGNEYILEENQNNPETIFNQIRTTTIKILPRTKLRNDLSYRIRLAVYICGELETPMTGTTPAITTERFTTKSTAQYTSTPELTTEGETVEILGPEATTTPKTSKSKSTTGQPSSSASTPTTVSTPSSKGTFDSSTATTSTGKTHICPLEEGMGEPQYLLTPEINGVHTPSSPNINPGGEGVTFMSDTAEIAIELSPSITPIVEYVSIADKNITNVYQVSVTIIASNGSVIQAIASPIDNPIVTGFPDTPLPVNSTLLITFQTSDKAPPRSVTLSIIACFHPELITRATLTTPSYLATQISSTTPSLSSTTGQPSSAGTGPTTIGATGSSTPPPSSTRLPTGSSTTLISMNNPQYINNLTIIGAPSSASPSNINPGSPGVDFNQINPSVTVPFQPGITPIVVSVSVPNKNTNVDKITV